MNKAKLSSRKVLRPIIPSKTQLTIKIMWEPELNSYYQIFKLSNSWVEYQLNEINLT